MKPSAVALLLSCLLGLAACEETRTTAYPLSGAPCAPGDPVQDLSAGGCTVPN